MIQNNSFLIILQAKVAYYFVLWFKFAVKNFFKVSNNCLLYKRKRGLFQ